MAVPRGESPSSLAFTWRGQTVKVTRNAQHPEHYMWIETDEAGPYFLGVWIEGMTRGTVRRLAAEWLKSHSQHGADR